MSFVRLEFGNVRRRQRRWIVVLLVLAVSACLAGLWRLSQTDKALSDLRAVADRLQTLRAQEGRKLPPTFAPSSNQIKAANEAIGALNLPWEDLFTRLGSVQSRDVALLTLEVEGNSRSVRLSGEARNSAAMLDYLRRLEAQEFFGPGVQLVKHELQVLDTNQSYRFEIQMQWGEKQ